MLDNENISYTSTHELEEKLRDLQAHMPYASMSRSLKKHIKEIKEELRARERILKNITNKRQDAFVKSAGAPKRS